MGNFLTSFMTVSMSSIKSVHLQGE